MTFSPSRVTGELQLRRPYSVHLQGRKRTALAPSWAPERSFGSELDKNSIRSSFRRQASPAADLGGDGGGLRPCVGTASNRLICSVAAGADVNV